MRGLPPEAAVWRAETGGWTQTDHLLASLIEVTDAVELRALKAQGAKRTPKPIRFPRPGDRSAPPKKAPTPAAVAALGGAVTYVPEGVSNGGS